MIIHRKIRLTMTLALLSFACSNIEAAAGENWEGSYLGVTGGYSTVDLDRVIHQTAPPLDIRNSFSFDETLLGVVGGYNHQSGQMILGIEAAFLSTPQSRSLVVGDPGVQSGAYSNQNWQGEILLRAGYDAGSIMPFIAGGPALGSFESVQFTGSPAIESGDIGETHWGFTAGAGVELQAAKYVRMRVEYRYSRFFGENYSFDVPGYYDQTQDFDSQAIRGSVIVHF